MPERHRLTAGFRVYSPAGIRTLKPSCRWLAGAGVPALRLLCGLGQRARRRPVLDWIALDGIGLGTAGSTSSGSNLPASMHARHRCARCLPFPRRKLPNGNQRPQAAHRAARGGSPNGGRGSGTNGSRWSIDVRGRAPRTLTMCIDVPYLPELTGSPLLGIRRALRRCRRCRPIPSRRTRCSRPYRLSCGVLRCGGEAGAPAGPLALAPAGAPRSLPERTGRRALGLSGPPTAGARSRAAGARCRAHELGVDAPWARVARRGSGSPARS